MASWIGFCRPAVGHAATAPFLGEPVSRVDFDMPECGNVPDDINTEMACARKWECICMPPWWVRG